MLVYLFSQTGLLIALQINNWNQERKTKLKSQAYMHEIVNDLATDTVNVNSLIHEANDSKSELMNNLSYFERERRLK